LRKQVAAILWIDLLDVEWIGERDAAVVESNDIFVG
jgi:hypothetical protein